MEEIDPFTFDEVTGRRLWRGQDVERPVYTDPQVLAAEIARREAKIIGVDGHDGSGKSFLSRQLGMTLDAQVIELDSLLIKKNAGSYLPNLDLGKLTEAVTRESQMTSIVEGVCLLAALESAGIKADVLVYVRSLSANFGHLWHEEDFHGSRGKDLDLPLHSEIRAYNWKYQPLVRADYFFDRIEQ
ncbi:MAG: hypothetical protein EOS36_10790 [Mesorhizobium sp.]|uniref:hypothetical protein n=1 Tax=Mesorhizobium sp. TaxID=1871066 RepID=UPI000FE9A3FF|nr:hypothetical protein [Mesorhizobium sp.]RWD64146.1 MAG: hypothetical protein EOS36_10790 [Mesorhizobium sp.]RWE49291.1 MAG: hypothetical protein EOS79_07710 [Mesorhizobium sp.]